MASAQTPVAARKIELIEVDAIEIGDDRLRPLDRARVEGIKATIGDPACPPLLPIEVCRKPGKKVWTLLDGLHRLTAYREAGIGQVEALVHDNSTITARMVELQRNLFVGELAPLERAKHIAELYYLERAKRGLAADDDPRKLGGRPPKCLKEAEQETSALIAEVSLSGAVGRSIGLQERQIRNYLALFRALSPTAAEKLERFRVNLPAAQLMLLAKQVPSEQERIVDRLLIPVDHPDPAVLAQRITTVSAALRKSGQKDADAKRLSSFLGSFARMSLSEKRGALKDFGKKLPAGFTLLTPDDDASLAEVHAALVAAFDLIFAITSEQEEDEIDDRLRAAGEQVYAAQIMMTNLLGGRS